MFQSLIAIAIASLFAWPVCAQVAAEPSEPTAGAGQQAAPTPGVLPANADAPVPAGATPEAVAMPPVTVSAPIPHIWTYQKGNRKVLVLGTVYPEPKGLTFIPGSIKHALDQSGAVIGNPWFHFSAEVNLFNVLPIWHAASKVKYLPDGKRLADVLAPADLQLWNAMKDRYLRFNGSVNQMRPMYAGWKLYDSTLEHSGVAVHSTVVGLVYKTAKQRGIPIIDAAFNVVIKNPKSAAKAFSPSPEADLACFQAILHGIQAVPESSRTMAKAWAVGDTASMQAYLASHDIVRPCWARLTDEAVASNQGLDLDASMRQAWLKAFNDAAAKYPVVFVTAPVREIFKPSGQIRWLLQEGYLPVPDAAQAAGGAPSGVAAVTAGAAAATNPAAGATRTLH